MTQEPSRKQPAQSNPFTGQQDSQISTSRNRPEDRLRLIIPKKGRLQKDFLAILQQGKLQISPAGERLDYGTLYGTWDDKNNIVPVIETLNQRAADAVDNLLIGLADMAVIGLDIYEEKIAACRLQGENPDIRISAHFNDISTCSLYIAAPQNMDITTPQSLENMRIATSYPNILRQWLNDHNVRNVQIIARNGGIEDYVRLGAADMVCDIVDTGITLKENNLTPMLKILDSCAILIQRGGVWSQQKAATAHMLTAYLTGLSASTGRSDYIQNHNDVPINTQENTQESRRSALQNMLHATP